MGIAVEYHTHLDFTEIKGYTLTVLILLNPILDVPVNLRNQMSL